MMRIKQITIIICCAGNINYLLCWKYKGFLSIIIIINTTATMMSCSAVTLPCCAAGSFISWRVRVTSEAGSRQHVSALAGVLARSHGQAKPAFCQHWQGKLVLKY